MACSYVVLLLNDLIVLFILFVYAGVFKQARLAMDTWFLLTLLFQEVGMHVCVQTHTYSHTHTYTHMANYIKFILFSVSHIRRYTSVIM